MGNVAVMCSGDASTTIRRQGMFDAGSPAKETGNTAPSSHEAGHFYSGDILAPFPSWTTRGRMSEGTGRIRDRPFQQEGTQ